MNLYENIKKYRKEKGLSQEELARKTGYTDRSSIAKIEKGDVDLPQSKIMLFAKALDVDPGVLMGDDGIIDRSEEERRLLSYYNALNLKGKLKVTEYLEDLFENEKYRNGGA